MIAAERRIVERTKGAVPQFPRNTSFNKESLVFPRISSWLAAMS